MPITLLWFRQDLRLNDNPALWQALQLDQPILPIYIHDENMGPWEVGAASRWWLHHSLKALKKSFLDHGSNLWIFSGASDQIMGRLCQQLNVSHVFWNRCYEPQNIRRDRLIKQQLLQARKNVQSFNGSLLFEPWEVLKNDQTPYKVFTPFWRALQSKSLQPCQYRVPNGLPGPPNQAKSALKGLNSIDIESLSLLPRIPWDQGFSSLWQPGEAGAQGKLQSLLEDQMPHYLQQRDQPYASGTSLLSPHLHFGEISPHRVWLAVERASHPVAQDGLVQSAEGFLRQLGWRDFAHHLLFHFPHTQQKPLDARFLHFPWRKHQAKAFRRWCKGQTGFPIVDAGMRQLWHTGWMHNRVRMITASLLTKNLRLPWLKGAQWFWDTLVDADLANNTFGWQWTAGCGADAAPYFRIFNPVRQGERFDPRGEYVRHWVPELAKLPDKWIHQPWSAPTAVLDEAHVQLDKNYPSPMIDLAESRKSALAIWSELKHIPR